MDALVEQASEESVPDQLTLVVGATALVILRTQFCYELQAGLRTSLYRVIALRPPLDTTNRLIRGKRFVSRRMLSW